MSPSSPWPARSKFPMEANTSVFSAGMLHWKPVGPSLLCAPNCGGQSGHGGNSRGAWAWLCVSLGHVFSWDTLGAVRIQDPPASCWAEIPGQRKKSSC